MQTGSSGGAGTGSESFRVSACEDAERIKGEATALHRAGEYEAAAREFSRAAGFLEGVGSSAAQSMLHTIRLSLAASQLKVRAEMCKLFVLFIWLRGK